MKVRQVLGGIFVVFGLGLVGWGASQYWAAKSSNAVTPTPLWHAEPIVPTALPVDLLSPTVPLALPPTATFTPVINTPTPLPATVPPQLPTEEPAAIFTATPTLSRPATHQLSSDVSRFGVGVPYPPLEAETAQQLGLGWYLSWRVVEKPATPGGIEFWQMVRLNEAGYRPDESTLRQVAQTNQGAVWLIGNEPDVRWQDNVTPARYAELYHELYSLLKAADPTAQVAIGGITQPTPLRLQYLDTVLAAYRDSYREDMPVDVWNIHNFILREERDSWGVDIPPGLTTDKGILFEINDHDDLDVFKAQIIAFRQWMAAHGQQNKPLIISEYGILMPEDYGFPVERVQRFMTGSYDFMLTATDEALGYPADGYRLVQRWAWYSLSDDRYPTGNLIDFDTGQLTLLGQCHREYINKLDD